MNVRDPGNIGMDSQQASTAEPLTASIDACRRDDALPGAR